MATTILTTVDNAVARDVDVLLKQLEERLRACTDVDVEQTDKAECQRIATDAEALRRLIMQHVPTMNDKRHMATKEECERYCCQRLEPIVRLATFNANRVM